ncbi:MAG: IS200/IS605 family transposase [Saprospiraceae bacterium]
MPFIRVYLHFVWATKNRIPFLCSETLRQAMWKHIEENARIKEIHTLNIGGYNDHCHCLISLTKDQTISKIAQLLKGESSFWINRTDLLVEGFSKRKFEWQKDYFVESVSPNLLPSIQNYILSQEHHHTLPGFYDEYDKFLDEFDL